MNNTKWQDHTVKRHHRENLNGHKGAVVWFTGLSGSGKSTLANELEKLLHASGVRTYLLDGDNVRSGLCKDLTFSDNDRKENIRRIGEVSNLMADAGMITLAAFISPFEEDRKIVRDLIPSNYIEVYCDAPLDVCEKRDVKGLYQKARDGDIAQFTGITSPYEKPTDAEIVLDTGSDTIENCVKEIFWYLMDHKIIAP